MDTNYRQSRQKKVINSELSVSLLSTDGSAFKPFMLSKGERNVVLMKLNISNEVEGVVSRSFVKKSYRKTCC